MMSLPELITFVHSAVRVRDEKFVSFMAKSGK